MENHTIYMITYLPTGEFYIGRTMQNPTLRFGQHIIRAFTSVKRTKFHELIYSSNINDFRLYILEEGIPTVEEAIEREKYYIDTYHACEIGLNTDPNATGFRHFNEELKNSVVTNYMNGYSIDNISKCYHMTTKSIIKIIKEKTGVDHVFYRGLIPAPYYIDPNQII